MIEGTPSHVPPEPDWLKNLDDLREQMWDEHTQGRDEDEPRDDELPGGPVYESVWTEAENVGDRAWRNATDEERIRYVTQAAIRRRQRASEQPSPAVVAERRPAAGLSVLTWADLLAEPPDPPPTIRPGIPKVGLVVVAGAPKIGKTLWVSQLVLETRQRALLVVEEGSRAGIAYRLRKQAFHLELEDPPLTLMHRQRVRLDDRESVKRLRAHVEETRPAIIGLDPLNRLHQADENKPSLMTPVMDSMANLAYDYECAVVAVHHMAKPSADRRGDIWDRFRGASSIRSGTDANLVLDGSTDRVHLVGEFRDGEPMSEWLELDRETLLFTPGDAPEAPTKIDPIVLRTYVEAHAYVTKAMAAAKFEVSVNTAAEALRKLGADEFRGPRNEIRFTFGTRQ